MGQFSRVGWYLSIQICQGTCFAKEKLLLKKNSDWDVAQRQKAMGLLLVHAVGDIDILKEEVVSMSCGKVLLR